MTTELTTEELEIIHRAKEAGLDVAGILQGKLAECRPLPDEYCMGLMV
jgi:hypothetical protein